MEILRDSFNKYILDRCMPRSFRNTRLAMIPKPDGSLRPIAVTEPYKMVFDRIILELIEPLLPLHDHQTAFRKNKSVMHNVAVVHTVLQTAESPVVVLIGLQKAYNTVCHKLLFEKLAKVLPHDLLLLIQMSICNNIQTVETEKSVITTELRRELPQGNNISPILFNFFISDLFECIDFDDKNILLAFADDLLFVSESREKAQSFCKIIEEYCEENLLILSATKSCYLAKEPCTLELQKIPLLQVCGVKYLGFQFDIKGVLENQNISTLLQKIRVFEKYFRKFAEITRIYQLISEFWPSKCLYFLSLTDSILYLTVQIQTVTDLHCSGTQYQKRLVQKKSALLKK